MDMGGVPEHIETSTWGMPLPAPQSPSQAPVLPKPSSPPVGTASPHNLEDTEALAGPSGIRPPPDIVERRPTDIVCGRGIPIQHYAGNLRLHLIVDTYREQYWHSCRRDKAILIRAVVRMVKGGGVRFLRKRRNGVAEGGGEWEEVDDKYAYEKVGHAFRSRHPAQKSTSQPPFCGRTNGGDFQGVGQASQWNSDTKSYRKLIQNPMLTGVEEGGRLGPFGPIIGQGMTAPITGNTFQEYHGGMRVSDSVPIGPPGSGSNIAGPAINPDVEMIVRMIRSSNGNSTGWLYSNSYRPSQGTNDPSFGGVPPDGAPRKNP